MDRAEEIASQIHVIGFRQRHHKLVLISGEAFRCFEFRDFSRQTNLQAVEPKLTAGIFYDLAAFVQAGSCGERALERRQEKACIQRHCKFTAEARRQTIDAIDEVERIRATALL